MMSIASFLCAVSLCAVYVMIMGENEKRSQWNILNYVSHFSLAVTIPWILYKVLRAVYLERTVTKLCGKIVVITGASSGFGEALAHEFYKQGAQVVLCARRRQELDRVRNDLLNTHPVIPVTYPPIIIPLDLSDINALPGHVKKILDITGHIDILVNNGGISHRGTVVETNPDVHIKVMLVNYFGAVALTKAVLPGMIKRKQGHIVCISSIQGLVALPDRSAYSASKHALQAFCDSLRAEMSQHNVNVTTVSPGYIKTALSLNAVTGSGAAHGQMDKTTETGYTPEFVAEKTVQAIVQKKKEIVISTFLPQVAIALRKYLPSLYFVVMNRRAKKVQ